LHYRDKDDLLKDALEFHVQHLYEQILDRMEEERKNRPDLQAPVNISRAVEWIFEQADENATLYQVILNSAAARKMRLTILGFLRDAAAPFFKILARKEIAETIPHEIIATYFGTSLLSFMTWWFEAGKPFPPSTAASYFNQLFFSGLVPQQEDA
jgi:AcrR family transcriptional regulator